MSGELVLLTQNVSCENMFARKKSVSLSLSGSTPVLFWLQLAKYIRELEYMSVHVSGLDVTFFLKNLVLLLLTFYEL